MGDLDDSEMEAQRPRISPASHFIGSPESLLR